MIGMPQASSNRSPIVRNAGASNWAKSGSIIRPKPVATISRPLRLSGRRRHAIRPHAANVPPVRRKTTRYPGTGSSTVSSGTSTAISVATTVAQSTIQKAG